jgi:hypothetical protein
MTRQPVESSQITAIGYDAATNTLEIEFKQGGRSVYQYANVTPEIHASLMGTDKKPGEKHSVGSYFIHNIKKRPDRHPYKKIEDAAAKA